MPKVIFKIDPLKELEYLSFYESMDVLVNLWEKRTDFDSFTQKAIKILY